MKKETKKKMFEKSIKFCEKTGRHHRWKMKKHGKRVFPTTCTDCGMDAKDLMEDIEDKQEKAEQEYLAEQEEKKRLELEEMNE